MSNQPQSHILHSLIPKSLTWLKALTKEKLTTAMASVMKFSKSLDTDNAFSKHYVKNVQKKYN